MDRIFTKGNLMLYTAIVIFFILQVGSGLLYKMGALCPKYWTMGFIIGNVLGISSIYFLMVVYKHLNPNLSEAICRGGYFILIQIAFILVYHSKLNFIQWGGISMILIGILIVSLYGNQLEV